MIFIRKHGNQIAEHMRRGRKAVQEQNGGTILGTGFAIEDFQPLHVKSAIENGGRNRVRHLNSPSAHESRLRGVAKQIGNYSDAVEVPASGRLLLLSGTPGLTSDGHLPETFEGQAEQAWKNVLALLERAGMGVQHVVNVSTSLVRSEDIPRYTPIRTRYLAGHLPASMPTVVPALVRPEFLIEVEVFAVAP